MTAAGGARAFTRTGYGKAMSQELAKLICKTLQENPGAEIKFTRRVEARFLVVPETPADKVVIAAEIQGNGRWLTCPMYEDCVHEAMPAAIECLRVSRAGDRLASDG